MEHNFFANGSSPSLVPSPSPSNVTRADLELDFRYTLCHWILAGLYLVPLALCLLWRLRPLLSGAPASFWQIIFVVNMLIGLLARMLFWVFQPFFYSLLLAIRQDFNLYWNFWPGFFFFSCYLVILCLWMEIYHSDSDQRKDFRWVYVALVAVIFGIVIGLMIGDAVYYGMFYALQRVPLPSNPIQVAICLYDGALYIVASIGFSIYGLLFYCKFRGGHNRQPLLSKTRFDILPRVKLLTLLCGIIFTLKAFLVIWSSVGDWAVGNYWWLDLAYYSTLEVLPLVLMMLVFRPLQPSQPAQLNTIVSDRRY